MDIRVLDTSLNAVAIIDTYKTLIWTDRYNQYGECEIHTAMSDDILDVLKQDYYLQIRGSEHVMIIDTILISTDYDDGNTLKITAKSLESILNRRIVWGQTTMTQNNNLQIAIQILLQQNLISPSMSDRKIDNFIFEVSTDPAITSIKLKEDVQYIGDDLYSIISQLCEEYDIGFKITLNDDNKFVFKLYSGIDRSYEQMDRQYVMFSPTFDNLINSKYLESNADYKNVVLVAGEDYVGGYYENDNESGTTAYIGGEGIVRKYVTVGSASGLDRREFYSDARDISSKTDDDTSHMPDSVYASILRMRGNFNLKQHKELITFEGEIDPNSMFVYGVDYFIGDIAQIENEYGHTSRVRILEMVMTDEPDGLSMVPTFVTVEEEDE